MPRNTITILAIETSCDETAVAVVEGSGGLQNPQFRVRSSIVSSQVKLHAPFGGVVPNLAKREHIKNLPIVLERALKEAGIESPEKELDALAVTVGPGLEPALWAGINFTQELAERWQLPMIAANHMEGHLVTPLLRNQKLKIKNQSENAKRIKFPAVALLVSGGHTELILVKNWRDYRVFGETLDDAAGEAFDKVARMLGLGYPGGPEVSRAARTGNRYAFSFPRPMINHKNYNFSFSGLKTAGLYTLRDLKLSKTPFTKNDIAASFEEAIIDVLLLKTMRAVREYRARALIIGGGVAANSRLRHRMRHAIKSEKRARLFLSPLTLTGDNAVMIGAAAYLQDVKNNYTNPKKPGASWKKLKAHATLSL